jgi:hypothetical protein
MPIIIELSAPFNNPTHGPGGGQPGEPGSGDPQQWWDETRPIIEELRLRSAASDLADSADPTVRFFDDAERNLLADTFNGQAVVHNGFIFNTPGEITAIRYWKEAGNTLSPVTVTVWRQDGRELLSLAEDATVVSAPGAWVTVELPEPVIVEAGVAYRAGRNFLGTGLVTTSNATALNIPFLRSPVTRQSSRFAVNTTDPFIYVTSANGPDRLYPIDVIFAQTFTGQITLGDQPQQQFQAKGFRSVDISAIRNLTTVVVDIRAVGADLQLEWPEEIVWGHTWAPEGSELLVADGNTLSVAIGNYHGYYQAVVRTVLGSFSLPPPPPPPDESNTTFSPNLFVPTVFF